MFDTLVKLTYNMQLYATALKVAITWNHNSNRNSQNYRHHKSSKISMRSEKIHIDGNLCTQMDLEDGSCDIPLSSSSMDITESNNIPWPSRPSFSQAVALAKTIVFLSQENDDVVDIDIDGMVDDEDEFVMHHDDHDDNIIGDDILDVSLSVSEDDEENMMLLESYGRRCTLPFLRFAALLKKYTTEDSNDNLDDHHDLTTILLSPQQHQYGNLNSEQQKQKEKLLDSQTYPSDHLHNKHSSSSVEVNYHDKDSFKNSSPNLQNYSRDHWSQDDNEFLLLARYLKLLNNVEEASDNYNEENNSSNYCHNDDRHNHGNKEIKHIPLQPPSAMEAVIWPRWSYSTTDNSDNVSTTISRAWLTSFREALTTKIPRSTIICENTTTVVSSAAAEIDPNSNVTTSANILMAARLLLAVDCCAGGGSRITSDNSDGTSDGSRGFLPTINWTGPRLLGLPYLYDDVFQYYHCRPCHRCHGVPRETSVCLVCGTVVCLKENCCKTNGISEAVQVRVYIYLYYINGIFS